MVAGVAILPRVARFDVERPGAEFREPNAHDLDSYLRVVVPSQRANVTSTAKIGFLYTRVSGQNGGWS
jgi:hypothetical protein